MFYNKITKINNRTINVALLKKNGKKMMKTIK